MLLNTSDKIYVGSQIVDRVYLGSVLVWPTDGPIDAYYTPDAQQYYVDPTAQYYYAYPTDPEDAYYTPDGLDHYVNPTGQDYYGPSDAQSFPYSFPVSLN